MSNNIMYAIIMQGGLPYFSCSGLNNRAVKSFSTIIQPLLQSSMSLLASISETDDFLLFFAARRLLDFFEYTVLNGLKLYRDLVNPPRT